MADFKKNNTTRSPFGRNEFRRSTKAEKTNSYSCAAASMPGLLVDGSVKTVSNKALTTNVATLTVAAHGFLVGQQVVVSIGDAVFDGPRVISAVPDANNISFERVNANVASAASTGSVIGGSDTTKVLQPGTILAKITSGADIGKVGVFQAGVSDGRQTTANIVGINGTFLPWQLIERDVEVAAHYDGAVVQAWCIEYNAAGQPIPLTNTTRDAMVALPNLALIFH